MTAFVAGEARRGASNPRLALAIAAWQMPEEMPQLPEARHLAGAVEPPSVELQRPPWATSRIGSQRSESASQYSP